VALEVRAHHVAPDRAVPDVRGDVDGGRLPLQPGKEIGDGIVDDPSRPTTIVVMPRLMAASASR
jgi:hypothetical protein